MVTIITKKVFLFIFPHKASGNNEDSNIAEDKMESFVVVNMCNENFKFSNTKVVKSILFTHWRDTRNQKNLFKSLPIDRTQNRTTKNQ